MESTVCTASMVLRDIASKRVVSVPAQRSPYYGQKQLPGPPLACWTLTPFFQAVFATLSMMACLPKIAVPILRAPRLFGRKNFLRTVPPKFKIWGKLESMWILTFSEGAQRQWIRTVIAAATRLSRDGGGLHDERVMK